MSTLVRVDVDLHRNPYAVVALPSEARPEPEPATVVLTSEHAQMLAALPPGEDVSARVIDQVHEEVLLVCREDDGVLLAALDAAMTAALRTTRNTF